jgi:CheY-like chemotaxis protein
MKILLLDNEDGEAIGSVLRRAGFEVVAVSNGNEAFRIYNQCRDFDLVLSDLEHPGLSAEELIREIHQKNPRQRYAFITGHPVMWKGHLNDESLLELVSDVTGATVRPAATSKHSAPKVRAEDSKWLN